MPVEWGDWRILDTLMTLCAFWHTMRAIGGYRAISG